MRKRSTEDRILLAASGELGPRGRRVLRRELEDDAGAAQYHADLERLAALARTSEAETGVRGETIERILRKAEQAHAPTPAASRPHSRPWTLLAPIAAAAALLVAGIAYMGRQDGETPRYAAPQPAPSPAPEVLAWDPGLDEQLNEIGEMLAMTYGEVADNGAALESEEEIASDLIELEGIGI